MKKQYQLDDVLEALRMSVELAGSQANCAEKLGVTQGYINDLLKGKREPGPKILAALGMRKVVIYERDVDKGAQEDRMSLEELMRTETPRKIFKLPCATNGCKKYIRGYLGQSAGGGAFYSTKGKYLADLRNQEYRCPTHREKE